MDAPWTNPDGKDRSFGGFRTKKDAERWLATEVAPKLAKGIAVSPEAGKVRFRDVAADWL